MQILWKSRTDESNAGPLVFWMTKYTWKSHTFSHLTVPIKQKKYESEIERMVFPILFFIDWYLFTCHEKHKQIKSWSSRMLTGALAWFRGELLLCPIWPPTRWSSHSKSEWLALWFEWQACYVPKGDAITVHIIVSCTTIFSKCS